MCCNIISVTSHHRDSFVLTGQKWLLSLVHTTLHCTAQYGVVWCGVVGSNKHHVMLNLRIIVKSFNLVPELHPLG